MGAIMATAHAPTRQPSLTTILTPKWRSAVARLRQRDSGTTTRILLLALVGLGFWSAIFGIAFRVLRYFRGVPDIGNLVAAKILGILLLAFLAILLLSNLITALSTFFLAKDLDLMVGAPVDWFRFYLSKLGETMVHSSWMVILIAIPIFTAYGFVFDGGLLFPFVAMAAVVPFLVVPAVLGSALTGLLRLCDAILTSDFHLSESRSATNRFNARIAIGLFNPSLRHTVSHSWSHTRPQIPGNGFSSRTISRASAYLPIAINAM